MKRKKHFEYLEYDSHAYNIKTYGHWIINTDTGFQDRVLERIEVRIFCAEDSTDYDLRSIEYTQEDYDYGVNYCTEVQDVFNRYGIKDPVF
jgi:hypothetical protein